MATLDYQNRDDSRREARQGFFRALFGPSRAEVWQKLADEINARHDRGGGWKSGRGVADVGPWQVTLDTYTQGDAENSTTYTRLRAPYVNADGFRFRIYRTSIFTGLGKLLGMQDIEIGDAAFDDQFVIQSNSPQRVKEMLASAKLRYLIQSQQRIMFQVRDDEVWFGTMFPQGVDELRFTCVGVIKDVDRLKRLFELFAETLQTLCVMGSAYERGAGVKL